MARAADMSCTLSWDGREGCRTGHQIAEPSRADLASVVEEANDAGAEAATAADETDAAARDALGESTRLV
jgi:hypothetical protein